MKPKNLFLIFLIYFFSVAIAIAQIYTPSGIIQGSSGTTDYVGIGTFSESIHPASRLHIKQDNDDAIEGIRIQGPGSESAFIFRLDDDDDALVLRNNGTNTLLIQDGRVGIGEDIPESVLHLDGYHGLTIEDSDFSSVKVNMKISSYTGAHGLRFIITPDGNWNNFKDVLHLASTGNVGIGTTDPSSKLTVNGEILCEKVRVIADIPWADYIFDSSYELKSIEEVEDYINSNKHLPDVPSEQEITGSQGLDIAEMNIILLKKIEEQTLYIIELNKRLKMLEDLVKNNY
jgi:hypothetical protein